MTEGATPVCPKLAATVPDRPCKQPRPQSRGAPEPPQHRSGLQRPAWAATYPRAQARPGACDPARRHRRIIRPGWPQPLAARRSIPHLHGIGDRLGISDLAIGAGHTGIVPRQSAAQSLAACALGSFRSSLGHDRDAGRCLRCRMDGRGSVRPAPIWAQVWTRMHRSADARHREHALDPWSAFPVALLPDRLKCPSCGTRHVLVIWIAPGMPTRRTAQVLLLHCSAGDDQLYGFCPDPFGRFTLRKLMF